MRIRVSCLLLLILLLPVPAVSGMAPQDGLHPTSEADDYTLREEMIAMRDGVRLFTLILTPKERSGPLPILLERTPYDADRVLGGLSTTRLETLLGAKYLDGGFIFVFQDIRGRFRSEGDYAMYRVPRGEFNQSTTDETTDAWDTIDWLVKNISESNGRIGVWGTSYPGWLTLAAIREPHPNLVAAVPFNPVVDVWKADDWFHWGAFRALYAFEFIYNMETRTDEFTPYPFQERDLYNWMLDQGSAGAGLGSRLDRRHEMWTRLMESPGYGPYWRACAADQWFDEVDRLVPTLHVHGFWDQEDIYGSPAVYAALEKHDRANDRNFFAAGPWYHGQHWAEGTYLGQLDFQSDTARHFRRQVLGPFLDRFLRRTSAPDLSPVTVFDTGEHLWETFESWPPDTQLRSLYLQADQSVAFRKPGPSAEPAGYVSDPAKPVPYAPRPNWGSSYRNPAAISDWQQWLVEDQRFVDGRPDVLTWQGRPLTEPLTVRGPVTVRLLAETTGEDVDWVVKLIDVYPDEDPDSFEMSGYQLMVSGDIFRGRYREDWENPKPLTPGEVLEYEMPLPHLNHTFRRGHRIMVQIQSSWFPLYDRNPQTWVPSIMFAPDEAYQAQKQTIHQSAEHPTRIEIRVDTAAQ